VNEPRIKGVSFVHLHDFVAQNHKDEGIDKVVARLTPEQGRAFNVPNATEWYPLTTLIAVERAIVELYYAGDVQEAWRFGQYDLQLSVGRVYRFLFQMLQPTFLIKRGAKLWGTMVEGGKMSVEELEPRHVRVHFDDFNPIDRVYCNDMRGSLLGMLEACGIKSGAVTHPKCVLDGAKSMMFDVTW
jgi:hypothetical protein